MHTLTKLKISFRNWFALHSRPKSVIHSRLEEEIVFALSLDSNVHFERLETTTTASETGIGVPIVPEVVVGGVPVSPGTGKTLLGPSPLDSPSPTDVLREAWRARTMRRSARKQM